MPLPSNDIRAQLAKLRSEFAERAALNSEYEREMASKYIHQMIPFEEWLAMRNAQQGKAKGGLAGFLDDSKIKHRVYHGTRSDFAEFKSGRRNSLAKGIYFAQNPEVANTFADTKKGSNVMPVHLSLKNPATWDDYERIIDSYPYDAVRTASQRTAILKKHGHDGVIYGNPGSETYIAFHPTQIKSAIGNRGTYDPNDPDITKASGGSVMGINVASDRKAGRRYADLIVDGHKTLESRNGDSLRPYVGKRVAIVRTGEGPAKAIGEVTIGEPMVVNQKKFRSLEDQHHVPAGSAYDIRTPTKHLYPLHNPVRYDQERDVGHGIVSRKVMASGGSVPSLDVMRLAIGGQGPRNFLKGTVEKVIDPLKQPEIYDPGLQYELHKNAINKWIESNLANYIRKQMGHPNDPVRKLAEEGILHFDPEALGVEEEQAKGRRQMLGGQKLAKGPLAQAWENAVDYQFEPNTVEDIKAMPDVYKGMHEPWMDKVDPKTPLYELYEADRLGFDHIVDILKEDLAQGRIRPEQLSKVSIEQAVRRAHQYDQERKKAMAETALKATEGMPVHKDYGDGFKWIELTLPKDLPEGWTAKSLPSGGETYYDPQGVRHVHPNMGKLADALKYEGDTMGHCVGGYCPDVAEGRSRIFSLRDAKNEPHVTVEVKPHHILTWDDVSMAVGPSKASELWNEFNESGGYEKNAEQEFDAFVRKKGIKGPERIAQIKGKGNAKPKKDYIPYVQDFVKSGNWSDVGDFQNTDLVKLQDHFAKKLQKQYVTKEEFAELAKNPDQYLKPNSNTQMADGGEVDAEEVFMGKGGKVKELEQYLRQREGEYGVKRLQRAADEIPGLENMYDYEALRSAFGGDNAQALMTMNPADFEKFAHRLGSEEDESAYEGGMTREQYLNKLIRIARAKGFRDVPFLDVGKRKPTYLPSIEGHEGRHRTRALAKMGEQKTLVRLFPTPSMREPMPRRYREDFIEAMKKELGEKRLVTPEGRSLLPADLTAQEHRNLENRNLVASNRPQLPEIYKDGGDVDPESVFFPKSKE